MVSLSGAVEWLWCSCQGSLSRRGAAPSPALWPSSLSLSPCRPLGGPYCRSGVNRISNPPLPAGLQAISPHPTLLSSLQFLLWCYRGLHGACNFSLGRSTKRGFLKLIFPPKVRWFFFDGKLKCLNSRKKVHTAHCLNLLWLHYQFNTFSLLFCSYFLCFSSIYHFPVTVFIVLSLMLWSLIRRCISEIKKTHI